MFTRPAAVLLALALGSLAAAGGMKVQASAEIPLDGTAVSLPVLKGGGEASLAISGTFICDIDGRTYDARFRTDSAGQFTEPHDLLIIRPREATLAEENSSARRYVYALPDGGVFEGESFTVSLNVDKLVHEFIRTPSRVRESLSGQLTADLLVTPPPLPIGLIGAAIGVPIIVVAGLALLALRAARRAAREPYRDVEAMGRRIERKCAAALQEVGSGEVLFDELRARIRDLDSGARELAEHVFAYREAKLSSSEAEIEAEIARLQAQRESAGSEDIARQCEEEVIAKRQTLEVLRINSEKEAEYLLRLARVETTIDGLRLKIPGLRVGLSETGGDQVAVDEVDGELRLLLDAVTDSRRHAIPAPTSTA